jgi:hypothetical protein
VRIEKKGTYSVEAFMEGPDSKELTATANFTCGIEDRLKKKSNW